MTNKLKSSHLLIFFLCGNICTGSSVLAKKDHSEPQRSAACAANQLAGLEGSMAYKAKDQEACSSQNEPDLKDFDFLSDEHSLEPSATKLLQNGRFKLLMKFYGKAALKSLNKALGPINIASGTIAALLAIISIYRSLRPSRMHIASASPATQPSATVTDDGSVATTASGSHRPAAAAAGDADVPALPGGPILPAAPAAPAATPVASASAAAAREASRRAAAGGQGSGAAHTARTIGLPAAAGGQPAVPPVILPAASAAAAELPPVTADDTAKASARAEEARRAAQARDAATTRPPVAQTESPATARDGARDGVQPHTTPQATPRDLPATETRSPRSPAHVADADSDVAAGDDHVAAAAPADGAAAEPAVVQAPAAAQPGLLRSIVNFFSRKSVPAAAPAAPRASQVGAATAPAADVAHRAAHFSGRISAPVLATAATPGAVVIGHAPASHAAIAHQIATGGGPAVVRLAAGAAQVGAGAARAAAADVAHRASQAVAGGAAAAGELHGATTAAQTPRDPLHAADDDTYIPAGGGSSAGAGAAGTPVLHPDGIFRDPVEEEVRDPVEESARQRLLILTDLAEQLSRNLFPMPTDDYAEQFSRVLFRQPAEIVQCTATPLAGIPTRPSSQPTIDSHESEPPRISGEVMFNALNNIVDKFIKNKGTLATLGELNEADRVAMLVRYPVWLLMRLPEADKMALLKYAETPNSKGDNPLALIICHRLAIHMALKRGARDGVCASAIADQHCAPSEPASIDAQGQHPWLDGLTFCDKHLQEETACIVKYLEDNVLRCWTYKGKKGPIRERIQTLVKKLESGMPQVTS